MGFYRKNDAVFVLFFVSGGWCGPTRAKSVLRFDFTVSCRETAMHCIEVAKNGEKRCNPSAFLVKFVGRFTGKERIRDAIRSNDYKNECFLYFLSSLIKRCRYFGDTSFFEKRRIL